MTFTNSAFGNENIARTLPYLRGRFGGHRGRRLGLEGVLRDEARVVGGDAGETRRGLLGQCRAAIAIVWGRGVRVRPTGSGVTTVHTVQTAVRDRTEVEGVGHRQGEGTNREGEETRNY